MMKKIIAAVVFLAVLLVVAGMVREKRPAASTQRRTLTAEVKKGPLVITVKGSGTIQAVNPNKIMPLIKRQATIKFLAPEGSRVAKGEVVAQLNADDIERDINSKETAFIKARSDLDAAQAALEIQKMDNAVESAKAQQELEAAKLDLEQFLQADEPVDTLKAELKFQEAQSELNRAKDTYNDYQDLFKEKFATKDEVEEQRMRLEKAKGSLQTASMEWNALEQFGLPVKLSNKQGRLESAKTMFEKARKQSDTQLRRKSQEVEVAKMSLDRAEKDLSIAREERKAYEIKAPVAGVLNYGDPEDWWRRRQIQAGGAIWPGQALLNIPDMSAMQAVAVILEADISKVQLGQKATIMVEALSGKALHGEVKKVPEVASRDNWTEGNQFKVEVSILNGKDLKTGLSCEAEIVTETIESTVYLPIPAVFREGDCYFVYPVKRGAKAKTEVKIGKASTEHVEILSGVEPGMKVFLTPPEKADEKK